MHMRCCSGESKRKHAVLLEMLGDKFRTIRYPLASVRPFVFEALSLRDVPDLKPEDPEGLTAFLEQKVTEHPARERAHACMRIHA